MNNSNRQPIGQYIGEYINITTNNRGLIVVDGNISKEGANSLHITVYTWNNRFYSGTITLQKEDNSQNEWQPVLVSEFEHVQPLRIQKNNSIVKLGSARARIKLNNLFHDDMNIEFSLEDVDDTHCKTVTLYHNHNKYSDNLGTDISWDEFRDLVTRQYCGTGFVFRGQPGNYRIRSSYHRTGNSDIEQYVNEYLPDLRRQIISMTPGFELINTSNQNLAILTLLQHHGYPTPVIDWTESPYIAAFFAYADVIAEKTSTVRIIAFNLRKYAKSFDQLEDLNNSVPHASFFQTSPLYNPRALPQQSVSCLTTIDDVERYFEIVRYSEEDRPEYIKYYSLPYGDRERALSELETMGITYATMFPGLDGVCRHYRKKHFYFADA